jgi:hypothetical protein
MESKIYGARLRSYQFYQSDFDRFNHNFYDLKVFMIMEVILRIYALLS